MVRDVDDVLVADARHQFDDGRIGHEAVIVHHVLRQPSRDVPAHRIPGSGPSTGDVSAAWPCDQGLVTEDTLRYV